MNSRKPRTSLRAQRLAVAGDPGIEAGRRRHQGAHVGGERRDDSGLRYGGLPHACRPELIDKVLILLEPPQIVGQSPPISCAATIGMATCSSSEEARPSQKKCLPHAKFHRAGVLRCKGAPERPSARRRPSVKALSGRWQRRAGAVAGPRQTLVGKQACAKRDPIGSERVVGRRGRRRCRPRKHPPPRSLDVDALGDQRSGPAGMQDRDRRDAA